MPEAWGLSGEDSPAASGPPPAWPPYTKVEALPRKVEPQVSYTGWALGNLLGWSGWGVPALKGESGLSDLQASFWHQISMNPMGFNNHCYVSGLGLCNLILWNQRICPPLGMYKEGGDRCCDGGGHWQRGPKEAPNPVGARLAGNEGKFPGRSDWSLIEQVKWGGEGHPRQKEQQVQRHKSLLCVICSGWYG